MRESHPEPNRQRFGFLPIPCAETFRSNPPRDDSALLLPAPSRHTPPVTGASPDPSLAPTHTPHPRRNQLSVIFYDSKLPNGNLKNARKLANNRFSKDGGSKSPA